MKRYIISKYKDNIIQSNDWTDFSDVGLMFHDEILTLEAYISVENKYIKVVNEILSKLKISRLYIKDYTENNIKKKEKNNIAITIEECNNLSRKILRNELTHCVFFYPKKFRLSFGFDYYMYISCNLTLQGMRKILEKYNLYC